MHDPNKTKEMPGLNFHFRMSIKSTLNSILLQMLRSSVVEIPSSLDTKTLLLSFSISAANSGMNGNF